MNSTYLFEKVDRLSDDYPMPALLVYAVAPCCRPFRVAVAAILEPDSVNPCIKIAKPLGVNAIKEILRMLDEYKQQ